MKFQISGNYCEGPEIQTLETLLQAYDEEDPEAAKRALNNPFIKHMDVEYAILARDMPLPEGMPAPPVTSVRENAAPSYESTKQRKQEVSTIHCKKTASNCIDIIVGVMSGNNYSN